MFLQKSPNWDARCTGQTGQILDFPYSEGFPKEYQGKTFTVITSDGVTHRGARVYTGNLSMWQGTLEWNFLDTHNRYENQVRCWIEESDDSKTEADNMAQMLHLIFMCSVNPNNPGGVSAIFEGDELIITANSYSPSGIDGSFGFSVIKVTDRQDFFGEEKAADLADFASVFSDTFFDLINHDPEDEVCPSASIDYDVKVPGQFTYSCGDGMGSNSHYYTVHFTSVSQK